MSTIRPFFPFPSTLAHGADIYGRRAAAVAVRSPYRKSRPRFPAGCESSKKSSLAGGVYGSIDTAECVGATFLVRDDPFKNGRVVDRVQNAARPHLRRTKILRGRSIFGRLDLSCENPTRYFHVYFLTRGGVVFFFFFFFGYLPDVTRYVLRARASRVRPVRAQRTARDTRAESERRR